MKNGPNKENQTIEDNTSEWIHHESQGSNSSQQDETIIPHSIIDIAS